MLNDLWAGMILVGIIYGALTGRMADVTNAALDSSKEAVTLCITMLGVMSFLGRAYGNCTAVRADRCSIAKTTACGTFSVSGRARRTRSK